MSKRRSEETLALFRKSVEQFASDYEQLISRADLEEEELWMFLERHYLLLAPTERVTMEKRKLGPYIPDFVLRFPDGTISFVEIQLNRDPIFLNDEPSDGMKEAVKQVGNWFNWLKEHSHSEVVRASGLIVIGRRISYMKHNKKIENLLRRLAYPVRLLTYDDLGDSVKKILELLS